METLLTLLTVASITVLAVLSPGPNFVVITKNALVYSRQAGVYTALGIFAGNAIYVTAGALGFTALVAQSEQLLTVVRLTGAAYLAYLGVTLFLSTRQPIDAATQPRMEIELQTSSPVITKRRAFRSGLFTMMTNPTAPFFYLTIFTAVLPSETMLSVKVIATIIILLITFTWHPLLAWFFSNRLFQMYYSKSDRWINLTFSLLLIGLAIRMVAF
jgi:threonine efflux protein